MSSKNEGLKLSQQAIGALLMTLQKCLAEETDITELLSDWALEIREEEVWVSNPPTFSMDAPTQKFEID
jgi:hypothetical protein